LLPSLLFEEKMEVPLSCTFLALKTETGRHKVSEYEEGFIEVAKRHKIPFFFMRTQTWRANLDWGKRVGVEKEELMELNRVAAKVAITLREKHQSFDYAVYVAGTIGPRGDGYVVGEKMTSDESESYSSLQVRVLADAGVDIIGLYTVTYPEEAIGVARAAHKVGKNSMISFTVETNGLLPGGCSLGDAINKIDKATDAAKPLFYGINCSHVTHFLHVFEGKKEAWMDRVVEVIANPSAKSHAELDESPVLDAGDPVEFGQLYTRLWKAIPSIRIFGGCCGTNKEHLKQAVIALQN
jgi:homocysteine S-methyltransferase